MSYPWKSRALCLEAPPTAQVDRFCRFIGDVLAKDKIDTLVLLTRYRYQFASHPECRGEDPISFEDARKIKAACDANHIRLIPKMNLLGHQTRPDIHINDALLRAHPELDETPWLKDEEIEYCRSICPTHPDSLKIVLELVDELAAAFSADAFHIGCDEVFLIGQCDRCRTRSTAELFSDWVNAISGHLKAKGITTFMWGDRLLDSKACRHGPWDASSVGTADAIRTIDKDIVICDWHYHNWSAFPSVDVFGEAGMQMYLCTFNVAANAKLFLDYAKEHDHGNILGIMETTWIPTDFFMDGIEGKPFRETDQWYAKGTPAIIRTYRWLFEDGPMPVEEDDD